MQKDYQSPLGRMQPIKIDIEKVKKDDERLSWDEQELIKQIGNKIYNNQNRQKT